ncbi:hypothetical protein H696_01460 [Fonticula alba]|uniref:EXPERA domain-containing protein n=1 Tax=Fonticula alba TaxID=691883 RepID=A0A058ZDL5_FONAL|nr:hypothetical protein H696_01460 [Fonticula alba]KCV72051.1 hypothetical protein H696_01460 [Fonticula alba]|eukprot:XP_009493629.1 hypothetical protein H696_01460 [Fonticula alba]
MHTSRPKTVITMRKSAASHPAKPFWYDTLVFLPFFLSHAFFAVCVDIQPLFSKAFLEQYYPAALRGLLDTYLRLSGDVLMATAPSFFRSFLMLELAFQLPFCLAAVYALLKSKEWIRIPAVAYGAHTLTTTAACLLTQFESSVMDSQQKMVSMALTAPFFLMSIFILIRFGYGPKLGTAGQASAKSKTN